MKFTTASALALLSGLAAADYTTNVPVVCSNAAPVTITKTVTASAAPYAAQNNIATSQKPYITTANGQVTSCDYNGATSTVYVYPAAPTGTKDMTRAIYVNNVVINVVVINININAGNTVTVTKSATYTPPPPPSATSTSTSSTAAAAATHAVTVGKGGALVYDPPFINAPVGDVIRFTFFAKNHTLTTSEFNTPCTFNGVFDTGFNQAVPFDNSTLKTVDVKVTSVDKPTWYYCRQTGHCSKGMVFAINPKSAQQFNDFVNLAKGTAVAPAGSSSVPATASTSKPAVPLSTAPATKGARRALNGRRELAWGA